MNDSIAPNVTNVLPVAGTPISVLTSTEIAADVADNFNVSAVRVNVTFPNGTAQIFLLARIGTTNKYNVSFPIPNVDGRYNVTFLTNDSNNNRNDTVMTYFITSDAINPLVFDMIPTANTAFNISDAIQIGANITDNVEISYAYANVTLPNGTNQTLRLLPVVGTNVFNVSFVVPPVFGRYNISFWANDTSNNFNMTETTFFIGNDSVAPDVVNVAPAAGTSFNLSDVVQISANVTDNFNVSAVLVNVTLPNSTVQQFTLARVGTTNKYNVSFTIPLVIGRYNVTFIANDSRNNNVNASVSTFFIANDSFAPNVDDVLPSAGSTYTAGTVVDVGANVTDNFNVSSVRANITFPNSTVQLLLFTQVGVTNKYNSSFKLMFTLSYLLFVFLF